MPIVSRLFATAALFPAVLAAQDFSIPATGVLNNYDRVQVGRQEAFEGGAYIARTNDAGASWYNPAGLVQVEKSQLNASAQAYDFTRTELEGLGSAVSRTRFTPVGRFFGAVVGAPIIKNPKLRLAFSVSKPIGWSPGAIDAALVDNPAGGGSETIAFYSLVSFNTTIPALAAGYRLSDRLRVGASVEYANTQLTIAQELTDRFLATGLSSSLIRTLNTEGSARQLMFGAGVQWEPVARVHLGAQVRTPGIRIGGSTTITFQRTFFGTGGSDDLAFRDTDARFTYKLPLFLGLGAAYLQDNWQIEVDARVHAGTAQYGLISSSELARRVLVSGTDVTSTPEEFPTVVQENKTVVNVAIGGAYRISDTFKLHAGLFTDRSPNADPDLTIFRSLNLTGGSLGVSATVGKVSGSFGLTGSRGTSAPRDIGPSIGGATSETRLRVTTLSVSYAIGFQF